MQKRVPTHRLFLKISQKREKYRVVDLALTQSQTVGNQYLDPP